MGMFLYRYMPFLVVVNWCVVYTIYILITFYLFHTSVIREARQGLPFTLSPEYQAAQRAYMRYHNMNPIFGISSK